MRKALRLLSAFGFVLAPLAADAATCDSLRTLKLTNTDITAAHVVAAGRFLPPGAKQGDSAVAVYRDLPAFCRVTGVIRPSRDSHIEFEVWLPTSGWNRNFMGVGNGGAAGSITYDGTTVGTNAPGLAQALKDGFATASTDTGHQGLVTDFSFARNQTEKRIDYEHRAIHETAVTAKAVIRAFYGMDPSYSYFSSCSGGGRQGLIEVQRYPADYDGVLAGGHNVSRTGFLSAFVWVAQAFSEPGAHIPERKLPFIKSAAVAACDTIDGVRDGVIDDPTKCRFDPAMMRCTGPESERCLTAPQVIALKKFYAGPRNSKGEQIAPGFPPGSEACVWGSSTCEGSAGRRASNQFDGLLNSRFNVRTFDFDRDVEVLDRDFGSSQATEANLQPFNDRGGKLIIEHGWSDGTSSPIGTVDYYNRIVSTMGQKTSDEFVRLYMVPGMHHCGGGPGPNGPSPNSFRMPMTTALRGWVEAGVAPGAIVATRYKTDGNPASGVARTRPLCPFPQVAVYTGAGSVDDAANFSCKMW